jgi:poly-gamma-glutamate biosynthesis protein PgsC/CapC
LLATNIAITMMISVLLSLLFTEITGVMPAGLVVPGYIALSSGNYVALLTLLLISLATYILVVFVIGKVTILYGKRKFTAMIAVGILLKMALMFLLPDMFSDIVELSAVGIVVLGLIANTIQRQGLIPTISSTAILTLVTFSLSMGVIRFF